MTLLDLAERPEPVYTTPKKVDPDSRLARVAALFMRKRGEWIDSEELAAVGGRCAWRTRVSECRTAFDMEIKNRQRRVEGASGPYTVSEYGYKVTT